MFEVFPMDDSICETPHAVGNAIARHAKHCVFSWVAASLRLQQNLEDVKHWQHALKADLQSLWLRYGSILQSDPRKQHQNVRITRKQFIHRLYHMGLMSLPLRKAADDGGVSSVKDPVLDVSTVAQAAPSDHGDGGSDDDDVGCAMPGRPQSEFCKQDLALMRDFLLATLKSGMHVSVPLYSDEFPEQLDQRFMQILSIEPKVVLPRMCKAKGDTPKFLDLGVPHVERHGQESADAESKADVFIFAEPASFDWGRCCPDDRGKYLQWEAHPSEIDGCTA